MTTDLAAAKGWKVASAILFVAVAAYFVYFGVKRPAWEWDVILYTLSALLPGSPDIAAASAKTWALIQTHVSPAQYAVFTAVTPYQADPSALASQLPLYESKLGFVLLLRALVPVADPMAAMQGIALVSGLGTLALLFSQSIRSDGIAALAWLPLAKLFGLAGGNTGPDMFAGFIYAAGFVAFLARRHPLAVGIFVLGVFVRPDNLILNLALGALMLRLSPRIAGALIVGSLGVYGLDILVSGHIGWWPQFHYNFVQSVRDLRGFQPTFDFRVYSSVLASHVVELSHAYWLYVAAAVAGIAAILTRRAGDRDGRLALLALTLAFTLRFLAYPSVELRLYLPILFGLAVVVLHASAEASRHWRKENG